MRFLHRGYHFFRDIVHRQIAMDAVAHLTLGVYGFGCEDALIHIFNYVWPNMLENSPHVIQRLVMLFRFFYYLFLLLLFVTNIA